MVYPTVEKDVLSLNQMLLTKMEDEYNNLMEVGIKGKPIIFVLSLRSSGGMYQK